MATWREIVQCDNSVFDEAIDLLLSSHHTGEEVHVELTRHDLSQWTGLGGDAARERLADVALRVEHLYASTYDFVAALADAQDGVGQVEHLVANAQTLIDKYGFTLDPVTAEVTDPLIDFLKEQARQAASGALSDSARSVNDRWIEISIRERALAGLLHVQVTFELASFWLAWKDDHYARKISRGVPRRRRTGRVEP